MAFCIEAFRKNKWKIIRESVVPTKEQAEILCESMLETCSTEEDRFLLVKQKYRVKRLRQKEVDSLFKKEAVV